MRTLWTNLGLDDFDGSEEPLAYTIGGDTPGQTADLNALYEIFHEQTKYHRATSSGIAANIRAHLEHPDLVTRCVMGRHRRTGPGLALPAPLELTGDLASILAKRVTKCRAETERPMRAEVLSSLLHHSIHAQRSATPDLVPELTQYFRPYPSAGALYPCEIYIAISAVEDLPAGWFRYDAIHHDLIGVSGHHPDGPEDCDFRAAEAGPPASKPPACAIVITSVFERSVRKYGMRGYRLALIEAGHILQNLSLVAASLGLNGLVSASFHEAELEALIGVDGVSEAVLASFLTGGSSDA